MIHSVCLSPCLTKNNFVHLFYFSTRFFPCRCAFFTKKCREARWYDLTFLSWLWFDIPKNIICREEQHHIFLIVRWACSHSSIQPPTTTNKWLYKRNGAVYMYKCSSSHPSIIISSWRCSHGLMYPGLAFSYWMWLVCTLPELMCIIIMIIASKRSYLNDNKFLLSGKLYK